VFKLFLLLERSLSHVADDKVHEGVRTMSLQLSHPQFLTVEEVAELLRVSPRSVYDWVSQEQIPFRKAGRRTIFLLDEILEWTSERQSTN